MVKRIANRANRAREDRQAKRAKPSTSDGDYVCEICGDSYDTEEKLRKHLKSIKVWNQGACHKCPKCGRGFHTETAVNKHVAWEHPELLYDRTPAVDYDKGSGDVVWRCLVEGCGATFDQHLSAQVSLLPSSKIISLKIFTGP